MAGASIPWLVETVPPVGVGLSIFFHFLFQALIGKFIPILHSYVGVSPLSAFFTFNCFLGFFILDWLCIETKGKSPAIIVSEYMNFKQKPCKFF